MISNSDDNVSDDHSNGRESDVSDSEISQCVVLASDTDIDESTRDHCNEEPKVSSRSRESDVSDSELLQYVVLASPYTDSDESTRDHCNEEPKVSSRRLASDHSNNESNVSTSKCSKPSDWSLSEDLNCDEWSWEPNEKDESILVGGRQYRAQYHAKSEELEIKVRNFVTSRTDYNYLGEIMYMYEDAESKVKFAHCRRYIYSRHTILGEDGRVPNEIFQSEKCDDIQLSDIGAIGQKVEKYADNESLAWKDFRNMYGKEPWKNAENQGDTLFCKHRYDTSSGYFRTLYKDVKQGCYMNCEKIKEAEKVPIILGDYSKEGKNKKFPVDGFVWCGETYTVGSGLFLDPGTITKDELSSVRKCEAPEYTLSETYDENKYPELYRKLLSPRGHIPGPCDPFEVSTIEKIVAKRYPIKSAKDLCLTCCKFYRPENTSLNQIGIPSFDLNMLYWSYERLTGSIVDTIRGKCYVVYEENTGGDKDKWTSGGPNRFYFSEGFDKAELELFSLEQDSEAKKLGTYKGDGDVNKPKDWPKISRPLNSLDVFAGCGGLTEGLHQSGAVNCKWAIEAEKVAATSFKQNFPNAHVFNPRCNTILEMIMAGDLGMPKKGEADCKVLWEKIMDNDSGMPKKGDVEMIYGRLPCRSYTQVVSHDEGTDSHLKNSRVMPFLSFANYLRPRFFLLENVGGFVNAGQGSLVRHTIKMILQMGYQVGVAVLQCGAYGVPQSRQSTIILAAAPGDILPSHPEPTHMFMDDPFEEIKLNEISITPEVKWLVSAPYRRITVRDAISELPDHSGGESMEYGSTAETHFQRMIQGERKQGKNDKLLDHQSKKLTPLVRARIDRLPQSREGREDVDWRDLPNKEVQLSNGKKSDLLVYNYNDIKRGEANNGDLRGVCECATKKKNKEKKNCNHTPQKNTLIPWCLPHTSDRRTQWSGLYGRIGWDYHFKRVVAKPDPMAAQGRVIHPELNRVVTVRENARAQGFPDKFRFNGTIPQKYAQVANAVPPPLGRAIGLEIMKSIAAKEANGV